MFRRAALCSLLVVFLVGGIVAGERAFAADDLTQDFSFAVEEAPILLIKNISGTVRVETWDRLEIKVTVSKRSDDVKVNISEDISANKITFEVENTKPFNLFDFGDKKRVDFTATVPRLTAFEGNLVSGDMTVEGSNGSLGDLDLELVSAEVRVDNAKNTEVNSTSGRIELNEIDGRVRARSVSGDVIINVAEDTDVNTTSGRVELGRIEGEVNIETVSGRIEVVDADAPNMRLKTISGRISAATIVSAGGVYSFSTVSGSITLTLPEDTQARIDASFISRGIGVIDFPIRLESTSPRELKGVIGDGSAEIKINTVSGKIDILQK